MNEYITTKNDTSKLIEVEKLEQIELNNHLPRSCDISKTDMNFVSTTATKLLCINSARISPLLAVFGSRYKSLYCQLTEADHANLQGLASGKI